MGPASGEAVKTGVRGAGRRARGAMVAASVRGCAAAGFAAVRLLGEWTFHRPDSLRGSQPNGHLTEVRVADRVLRLTR